MTPDDKPPQITLPAASMIELLADLLTQLDEFLRSGSIIANDLADFLARHGHTHPRFAAGNLIDEVSFTAVHLHNLTHRIPRTTVEYVHVADFSGK